MNDGQSEMIPAPLPAYMSDEERRKLQPTTDELFEELKTFDVEVSAQEAYTRGNSFGKKPIIFSARAVVCIPEAGGNEDVRTDDHPTARAALLRLRELVHELPDKLRAVADGLQKKLG